MDKTGFLGKMSVSLVILFLMSVTFVIAAVPEGPSTLTTVESTRRLAAGSQTLNAFAGNVSHLTVVGTTVTQGWQGYVGNVTGTITLDDSLNKTLYDWSLGDPEGEIYATYLLDVTWTTGRITCWQWNTTGTATNDRINGMDDNDYLELSEIEGWDTGSSGTGPNTSQWFGTGSLNMAKDDVDGINETFLPQGHVTGHASFYVGGQLISGSGSAMTGACPLAKTYNGSEHDSPFEEVILYYNATGVTSVNNSGLIFTSILESDENGYNNDTWDFQMIVPEDGHNGDTSVTPYYFYVELE